MGFLAGIVGMAGKNSLVEWLRICMRNSLELYGLAVCICSVVRNSMPLYAEQNSIAENLYAEGLKIVCLACVCMAGLKFVLTWCGALVVTPGMCALIASMVVCRTVTELAWWHLVVWLA